MSKLACIHRSMGIATLLSLSACATPQGDFPSLSKRPYETAGPVEEPDPALVVRSTTLPSEIAVQTEAWLARNRAADAAFSRQLPAAQSAARAASGAALGSESWAQAHVQLSRLDSSRADSVTALAELDRLIATQREGGADAGLIEILSAVQNQMSETVTQQSREIARLAGIIGR